MRFDEPRWWYESEVGWQANVLAPAASIVARLAARRLARGTPYRSNLPVICIGNFTAGGTGKTPLALHVAGVLAALGRRPVFLTRGYGGSIAGPHLVDAALDTAAGTGDEPLLLARLAPTVICSERAQGARFIEALAIEPRPDAIIMDDGLQNPALAKTLTLAVVDARRGFGNGRVLPAGPLRAPLELQLPLVHAIVVNGEPEGGSEVGAWLRSNFMGPVLSARVRQVPPVDWLSERPAVAYCGIGAPDRFFRLLKSLGTVVAAEVAYPDHHVFTRRDALRLLSLARDHGAQLVTTEKDWVRLEGSHEALVDLKAASRPLAVTVHFDDREAVRLGALVEGAVR